MKTRFYAGALALLIAVGIALMPIQANASEKGRRNTAIGLGALSAFLFTRGGSKVPAFLALGGAAYAYKRYDDSVRARHRRQRYYRHRSHRHHR